MPSVRIIITYITLIEAYKREKRGRKEEKNREKGTTTKSVGERKIERSMNNSYN